MEHLRIVFFGTPEYSLLVLEPLYIAGFQIAAVVTKPPRLIGRKQIMTPTPVALWAQEHNIPLLTPSADSTTYWKFADEKKVIQEVLAFKPQLLVVADYTQKIPAALVNATEYGGFNVHPSLLPNYRGPAPIPWAIYNGETETGVSIVTLAEEFDTGEIIAQEKEAISATDTTPELLDRLFKKGGVLLVKVLNTYLTTKITHPNPLLPREGNSPNKIPPLFVRGGRGSYARRLTKDDGFEPWTNIQKAMSEGSDAVKIERKFRAFQPWPGIWTKVTTNNQEKRLLILQLHLQITDKQRLVLDEIQLEGKKPVSGKDSEVFLKSLGN
jgi:methionyl-tRNA formyltransferase